MVSKEWETGKKPYDLIFQLYTGGNIRQVNEQESKNAGKSIKETSQIETRDAGQHVEHMNHGHALHCLINIGGYDYNGWKGMDILTVMRRLKIRYRRTVWRT